MRYTSVNEPLILRPGIDWPSDQTLLGVESSTEGRIGVTADGNIIWTPDKDIQQTAEIQIRLISQSGETTKQTLAVSAVIGSAQSGFGQADHYVLPEDDTGSVLPEAGQNHRLVYVSPNGSRTGDGLTPETAVTPEGLSSLLRPIANTPSSWWVLFERGHNYGEFRPPVHSGESPLHPFVIGAWGEGDRPNFTDSIRIWNGQDNVLVRDLSFTGAGDINNHVKGIDVLPASTQHSENLYFENLVLSGLNDSSRIQGNVSGVTLDRVIIVDAHRNEPAKGAADWTNSYDNRIQGIYIANADGILIKDNVALQNGWRDGYSVDGASGPQPPSMFSHNYYLHANTRDVTFRDNIVGEAASVGAQLRGGAVVDGSLFFANNAAFSTLAGGGETATQPGNDNLVLDTAVIDPSNKDALQIGARGWGVQVRGEGHLHEVIIANDGTPLGHVPEGVRHGLLLQAAGGELPTLNDVTLFNWGSDSNINPPEASLRDALIALTMKSIAQSFYGDAPTAEAALDLLKSQWRAQDRNTWDTTPTALEIIAKIKAAYGYTVEVPSTTDNALFTFDGSDDAGMRRWDIRLNWVNDRAPVDGAYVDLDGWSTIFNDNTLTVNSLSFGSGGGLIVKGGSLTVDNDAPGSGLLVRPAVADLVSGGHVETERSGIFSFDGYGSSEKLQLFANGGRIANTGDVSGTVDVVVSNSSQFIIARDGGTFALNEGSRFTINGASSFVGFDAPSGASSFILSGGSLEYIFDARGTAKIREFSSGAFANQGVAVESALELVHGHLQFDLSRVEAEALLGRAISIVDVDRIVGSLADIDVSVRSKSDGIFADVDIDERSGELYVTFLQAQLSAIIDLDGASETVAEDAAIGTSAGWQGSSTARVNAGPSLPVSNVGVNWSIVSIDGVKAGASSIFAINTHGQLSVSGRLDYESQRAHTVVVRAEAGNTGIFVDTVVAVNVLDIAEGPVIAGADGISPITIDLLEGNVLVKDFETVGSYSDAPIWRISGGADAALFSIDARTGLLVFSKSPDYESARDLNADGVYEVDVSVSDGLLSTQAAVHINIQNVVETIIVDLSGTQGVSWYGGTDQYVVTGTRGHDVLVGGAGNDVFRGMLGDDVMHGGDGDDLFVVGGLGDDTIDGGAGYDRVVADRSDVRISGGKITNIEEISNGGFAGFQIMGTDSSDSLIFADVHLSDGITINGRQGEDIISTGAGNQTIIGGAGADVLSGGLGGDIFAYLAVSHSTMKNSDTILDLSSDDRIDLSAIDANTGLSGNQSFWLAEAGQSAPLAGAVFLQDTANGLFLSAHVDGDGRADMGIHIWGVTVEAFDRGVLIL